MNIVLNHDTVIHIINTKELENIIDALEANIIKLNLDDVKAKTLEYELNSLRNKIKTLIPHRQKRGLFNFVGTIHKWLYGTMNEDDREEIESHLKTIDINSHNIIENINQQVKINKNFNETFLKLKELIEEDRSKISYKLTELSSFNKILYTHVTYLDYILKLKILRDNIEHIQQNSFIKIRSYL